MSSGHVNARAVAKATFVAILVIAAAAGVGYLAVLLGGILRWLFLAAFLSIVLLPPVDWLSRRIPRALSIFLVYIGILATIVGVGALVVPPIVSQVEELSADMPSYINEVSDYLDKNKTIGEFDDRYHVTEELKKQASVLPSKLGGALGTLSDVTVGIFQKILALVTILALTFLILLDGPRFGRKLLEQIRPDRAIRARKIAREIHSAITGYVFGNLIISIVAGLLTFIVLTILGIPFAVPLAVLMAFLDLIPMVGATIGAVAIGIVVAIVNFPVGILVWALTQLAYQQAENYLLQPLIYRRTVKLHPLIVIVAVIVGGTLQGVLGALVAIPVAAGIQIVAVDWWNHRKASRVRLSEAAAAGEA